MPKTTKEKFVIPETANEKPILCDLTKPFQHHDKNLIIFCHGYKGFKDWGCWNLMADKFAQNGISFLKFNFSHNGGTINNPIDFPDLKAFSENNYSIEVNDVIRVVNYVKNEFTYFSNAKIHLMGHSRGGGIACIASSRDLYIESLILLASVSDYKNRFPEQSEIDKWKENGVRYVENKRTKQKLPHLYQFYQNYVDNESNLNIESSIKKFKGKTLICHGTMDLAVDFQNALNLLSWSNFGSLFKLRTNHTFGSKHPWNENHIPTALDQIIEKSISFLS
ncbi:MAG: alpha/beta fold hydrolase [Bacteroidota bacterium]|nr:alpha/beta fold hydrolase [Bacteroidota bacterium]